MKIETTTRVEDTGGEVILETTEELVLIGFTGMIETRGNQIVIITTRPVTKINDGDRFPKWQSEFGKKVYIHFAT